jgi:hypothetical protein
VTTTRADPEAEPAHSLSKKCTRANETARTGMTANCPTDRLSRKIVPRQRGAYGLSSSGAAGSTPAASTDCQGTFPSPCIQASR